MRRLAVFLAGAWVGACTVAVFDIIEMWTAMLEDDLTL